MKLYVLLGLVPDTDINEALEKILQMPHVTAADHVKGIYDIDIIVVVEGSQSEVGQTVMGRIGSLKGFSSTSLCEVLENAGVVRSR